MDEPSGAGDTLRQDPKQAETSRRLSGKEQALQDPAAPAINGYTLVSRLGAGAYGEVWKAWQQRTGKWVALKIFPRRHGVDWLLLQREVERLIKLDKHPNVVSLLDADLTGDPPYFAMELMEGGSLSRFVDPKQPATAEQAARWAEEIAEALCYVHSKGILHCDLKPANVLLDDQGRVRVADFGQSRIASESTGALGTLYFMAPEQALTFRQNEQLCPDVRWDLFGLGATLHAVLTGRPPHEAALRVKLEAADGLDARLEAYRDGIRREPVPDSGAEEDLAAIIRCLLEPWPERRYTAAREVLADLAARRGGRPVSPLASGFPYRLRKFLGRNAVPVALGALLAVALAGSGVLLFRKSAALQTELANAYLLRARAAADKGDDAAAAVLFARSNVLHASPLASRSALSYLDKLEKPPVVLSLGASVGQVAINSDGSRVLAGAGDALSLYDGRTGKLVATVVDISGSGENPIWNSAFNADGSRAFAVVSFGEVHLIDVAAGKAIAKYKGTRAAFSPDGKLLAVAQWSGGALQRASPALRLGGTAPVVRADHGDGVHFLDAATGVIVGAPAVHQGQGQSTDSPSFAFSEDGKSLLTSMKGVIEYWQVPDGKPAGRLAYDPELRFAIFPLEKGVFSPDGSMILSLTWSRGALFDRASGKALGKVMRHDEWITDGVFTRNGNAVVTAGKDGAIRYWQSNRAYPDSFGLPAQDVLRHGGAISSLALRSDGKLFATGGSDGVARLWSLEPWGSFGKSMVHASPVLDVAFSKDGKTLATSSRDGTVRVWDVASVASKVSTVEINTGDNLFSPDVTLMFGRHHADGSGLFRLPAGPWIRGGLANIEEGRNKGIGYRSFDAAGKRVATIVHDANKAEVWDTATGARIGHPFEQAVPPGKHSSIFAPRLSFAILSPDGLRLLTYGLEEGVTLWEVDGAKRLAQMKPEAYVAGAAFSPDGSRIAFAYPEKTEIRDGALGEPKLHVAHGGGVVWSPDGRRFATRDERSVRLWDAGTGAAVGAGVVHETALSAVLFSRDGRLLMTASRDGSARLLDARSGTPIGSPIIHGAEIWSAAISPNGETAATGGMDGVIRLWHAATAEPVGRKLEHGSLVNELAFSTDGAVLYSVDMSLKAWDVGWLLSKPEPKRLLATAESLTQRRVEANGGVVPIPIAEWNRGVPPP